MTSRSLQVRADRVDRSAGEVPQGKTGPLRVNDYRRLEIGSILVAVLVGLSFLGVIRVVLL